MNTRLPDSLRVEIEGTLSESASKPLSTKPDDLRFGVVLARIRGTREDGRVQISFLSADLPDAWAQCLSPLDESSTDRTCAVQFVGGDTTQPIVMGLLLESTSSDNDDVATAMAGERVVIEAQQEIELRCGDARILLTRDGIVQIRGTYVTSHASATQRIRGGSVQLN
ncbi:DUF6484 domain-containing protein [Burkholderia sp. BCC0419]|uniref:DUF6484 domain-containing protein n=1 Tax=Burkholderia sp. BCC0419 TaxID=486878 RepID=UPI00158C18C5|nr:DUF6484 domain-containing protein [Burkholderia sp. BCC0419]